MRFSIIYHSVTGNTKKLAELIAEGIKKEGDFEIRLMSVDDIDEKFVESSQVVLFGCPTYAASLSWQMKKFFDTVSVKLAGKLGGVFATQNYVGGGAGFAELAMISAMLVKGMLIYSGGCANGNPYIHYGVTTIKDGDEWHRERAVIYGRRMASKAKEIF
jgi:NAD(P)H dehydrogenase (quinone)